jgi:hypothetical protein
MHASHQAAAIGLARLFFALNASRLFITLVHNLHVG